MIYMMFYLRPTPGTIRRHIERSERFATFVEKYGGKIQGAWTIAQGRGQGEVVGLIGYPDWAALGAALESASRDYEWPEFFAEVDAETASLDSVIMTPLPISPLQ